LLRILSLETKIKNIFFIDSLFSLTLKRHLTQPVQLWRGTSSYKPPEKPCKMLDFEKSNSVELHTTSSLIFWLPKKQRAGWKGIGMWLGFGWDMKSPHLWKWNLFVFELPWKFQVFRDFDLATILQWWQNF
jgi:hypothetical protein